MNNITLQDLFDDYYYGEPSEQDYQNLITRAYEIIDIMGRNNFDEDLKIVEDMVHYGITQHGDACDIIEALINKGMRVSSETIYKKTAFRQGIDSLTAMFFRGYEFSESEIIELKTNQEIQKDLHSFANKNRPFFGASLFLIDFINERYCEIERKRMQDSVSKPLIVRGSKPRL